MKTKRSAFNLIELTLAIAVVGIGIASIMALFVPAIDSTKNAIADNYAPDVVNTFVSYLTASLKQDNSSWENRGINTPNSLFHGDILKDTVSGFENPNLQGITYDPVAEWTEIKGFSGLYTTTENGVFGVKTGGGEFTGYLCVWRKQITDFYNPEGETIEEIGTDKALRICFELSWPAGTPYEARERRLYTIELFNDNAP